MKKNDLSRWLRNFFRNQIPRRLDPSDLASQHAANAAGMFAYGDYVDAATVPPPASDVRLIAYYLPQFHPIPENDHWWGKGFTEWRNVTRAVPLYDGHYQPRSPAELGYYDLRLVDVMRRQVDLAKLHGIGGFAFHFYWFGGKRLLDGPVENYLKHTELDLPFSLCWSNENWSRSWNGSEKDILIAQDHSPNDDIALIRHLDQYFRDPRYIKIAGKPVFTVCRPDLLPDAAETLVRWRHEAEKAGWPGLYIIATNAFDFTAYHEYDFDALSEFPPHGLEARNIEEMISMSPLRESGGRVRLYEEAAHNAMNTASPGGRVHPGVMPGWDNCPRRPRNGEVYHGATPEMFGYWLQRAVERARGNPEGERLVFINAWNDWGEGAYLEPDLRYGYGFLQACREMDKVTTDKGRTIYFDPADHRGKMLKEYNGNFNPSSLLMWDMLLTEAPWTHVIDVGSNYGEMLANVQLPVGAEITAIEPNSLIRPHLKRTLKEAGIDARFVWAAASDSLGKARFLRDDKWSGTSRVLQPGETSECLVEVPQVTVDSLLANTRGTIRLAMKIDVEGHEAAVLRGAERSLERAMDYSILAEIKHIPQSDQAWIFANFEVYGLDVKSGCLVCLTGIPHEEIMRMIQTEEIYAQDVIVKRKGHFR